MTLKTIEKARLCIKYIIASNYDPATAQVEVVHIQAHLDTLIQDRQAIATALLIALEGENTKYEPADLEWEGDEEQEVGKWKYVPAKDPKKAMYCLNCERFLHEEGCICGMITLDQAKAIVTNLLTPTV